MNEPNLQNVSPNLPMQQQSTQNKHQVITQNNSNISGVVVSSSSSSTSNLQQQIPLGKLSSNDIRLQQSAVSSPYNSNNSNSTSTTSSTPSLVVSVPLSTATVPGVNLPPSTSATIIHLNQLQQNNNYHQQQQSNVVQQRQTEQMTVI